MARSVPSLALSLCLALPLAAAEPSLVRQSAFGLEPYIVALMHGTEGPVIYAQAQSNLIAYKPDTGSTLREVQRIDLGAYTAGIARHGSILIAPMADSRLKVYSLDASGKATLLGGGNPVAGFARPMADSSILVLPTEDSLFWLEGYRTKEIGNRASWKAREGLGFRTQVLAGSEIIQATGTMDRQGWFHRIPLIAGAAAADSQAYPGVPVSHLAYVKGVLFAVASKEVRSYAVRADSLVQLDAFTLAEYGQEIVAEGEWVGVKDHSAGGMTLLKHASGIFDKAGAKRVPIGYSGIPLSLSGGVVYASYTDVGKPYSLARFLGGAAAERWLTARPGNPTPLGLIGGFALVMTHGDKPRIDAVDFRDPAKPAWAGSFEAFEDERHDFHDFASCGEWGFLPNRSGNAYGFKVGQDGRITLAWKHKGKSPEGEEVYPTQVECDGTHLWLGGEVETEVFSYSAANAPVPFGTLDPAGKYLAVSGGRIASRGKDRSTLAVLKSPAVASDSVALDLDPANFSMVTMGSRVWFHNQSNGLAEVDPLTGRSVSLPFCGAGSLRYGDYLLGAGCGFDALPGVPLKGWEPAAFDKTVFRWVKDDRIYGTNPEGLVLWKDLNGTVGLAGRGAHPVRQPRARRQGLPMRAFLGRR